MIEADMDNSTTTALRQKIKKQAADILLWKRELAQAQSRLALLEKNVSSGGNVPDDVLYENAELMRKNQSLQAQLNALLTSTSWTLTRPLRRLSALLKGSKTGQEFPVVTGVPATHIPPVSDRHPLILPRSRCLPELSRGRRIFMFSGVPYDDIGGGQRAAQLTRILLQRGEQVVFLHAYRKWEQGQAVPSHVRETGLLHLFLDDVDIEQVVSSCTPGDLAIFEFPHPAFLPYFERFGSIGCRRVFELIDAWDSSLGADWFDANIMDRYIAHSEVVVGTARVLHQQLMAHGRSDALYAPNAANEAIFDRYRQYPVPFEYVSGKRAFLYFGSLYGEWFDWDSLNQAARRCAEDAVFYLIGDPPADIAVEPNVHLLGARQIEALPAYLAHCDAALIPFKPGHISDAVSPIKVFEYIAMGAAVIANRLPEIEGYPNVRIADSAEEFAALCAAPQRADCHEVDTFLIGNSWASRVDVLVPPAAPEKCISAIVLIHNNQSIIARCLRSLQQHGQAYLQEIIVVDNASTDGGADLVRREFPDVTVLTNPDNGCSSGRNLGVAHSSGRFIAFFDSDQWLTGRACFEEALAILTGNPDIGAVGWAGGWFSSGDTLGGPIFDYLPHRGTDTDEYQAFGYRTDMAYLATGGLFLARSTFDGIGGFDEAYDPTCFEDTDLAFALLDKGWRLAYRNFQGVRHQPHQTTQAGGQSDTYKALFKRNSDYFRNKWKHRPEFIFDLPEPLE